MPTYERETRVGAPLEDVWDFYSRVDGLVALTPSWTCLQVESVVGPDGEPNPGYLDTGSEITLSVRPFGLGPRRRWTSLIRDRERSDGSAYFRDEMIDGPFDRWIHTHSFYADGEGTILRDRVEYRLPGGPIADALGPVSPVGFGPMFRHRHRKTRELLESPVRIDRHEG